jgi:hypothetical protein
MIFCGCTHAPVNPAVAGRHLLNDARPKRQANQTGACVVFLHIFTRADGRPVPQLAATGSTVPYQNHNHPSFSKGNANWRNVI